MLNISNNNINKLVDISEFDSYKLLVKRRVNKFALVLIVVLLVIAIISMFLPWTQNIQAKGYVNTRTPDQRPQAIQSVISGRIDKWYVQEGDYVEKGDTIIFISEVKSEYFDPELVQRTAEQVDAKAQSVNSYDNKIRALQQQYRALAESQRLKIDQTQNKILQAKNKIVIDSIDLQAYRLNLEIAENQMERVKQLYDKGIKSLSEYQEKELKWQQTRAKVIAQENKLLNQKNELSNLKIELNAVQQDYADKLAKSQSDQQTALSAKLEAVANTSKLRNQLSNYTQRQQFYYILAPQSGYITKAVKKGLGEILKEGTDIVTIMPSEYELAIEIYVKPQDLPLLSKGDRALLRFDGWPAIVISGWPEASTGIFAGRLVAIDQFISDNGYYRVMISPTEDEKPWPKDLRVGAGVNTFILLRNVPIWYEIWRLLNGFPPDYYKSDKERNEGVKLKAPLKSVK